MSTEVKGYKPLSEWQKVSMNQVKELEEQLLNLLRSLGESSEPIDPRSMSIARTNLEQASMWACRAIAQPKS